MKHTREDLRIQPSRQSTYSRPVFDYELAQMGYVKLDRIDAEALARNLYWLRIALDAGDLPATDETRFALDTLDLILAAITHQEDTSV